MSAPKSAMPMPLLAAANVRSIVPLALTRATREALVHRADRDRAAVFLHCNRGGSERQDLRRELTADAKRRVQRHPALISVQPSNASNAGGIDLSTHGSG
jgi:hypothetical protein